MKTIAVVRLSDIAGETGVSISLVSKILNGCMGSSKARPEVVESIRACARRRGYVPNGAARALTSGRQGAVGIFLAPIGQPGSGLMERTLSGISRALAENHLRAVLRFFTSASELDDNLEIARPETVDGILIGGGVRFDAAPAIRTALGRNLPVVTALDAPQPAFSGVVPNVAIDPRRVGELAAERLLRLGCRKLLCIEAPGIGQARSAGFRKAVRAAGLPLRIATIAQVPGFDADVETLGSVVAPIESGAYDGVLTASDVQAACIVNRLVAIGVAVPERIKVIGIDDSPGCAFAARPLTSISGSNEECGYKAALALCAKLSGRDAPGEIVEPTLVERASG